MNLCRFTGCGFTFKCRLLVNRRQSGHKHFISKSSWFNIRAGTTGFSSTFNQYCVQVHFSLESLCFLKENPENLQGLGLKHGAHNTHSNTTTLQDRQQAGGCRIKASPRFKGAFVWRQHISSRRAPVPSQPTGKSRTASPFESCRCRRCGRCWVPASEPSSLDSVSRGDRKGSAGLPTERQDAFNELKPPEPEQTTPDHHLEKVTLALSG